MHSSSVSAAGGGADPPKQHIRAGPLPRLTCLNSQPGTWAKMHQQWFNLKGKAANWGASDPDNVRVESWGKVSLNTTASSARRDLAKRVTQKHWRGNSQRTSHGKTKSSWLTSDRRPIKRVAGGTNKKVRTQRVSATNRSSWEGIATWRQKIHTRKWQETCS